MGGDEIGSVQAIGAQLARLTAENSRLLQRLTEGERRFRLISRGVLKVQEAERGRISRELHDGVGQSLTALKIQLELLEQQPPPEPELRSRLAELREMADRALQEVRQISHLLRPQMLDELGLGPTLRWLARTLQHRTGIEVALELAGVEEGVDPDVDTLVFRVVQEALTNVAKHAGVARAEVRVRRAADRLSLRVKDAGAGFDVTALLAASEDDRGFGLRGMRDRVHLFGGRFTVHSAAGQGTTLEAEVPLEPGGRRA